MIKVIDSLGEVHTIPEALWERLKVMPKCKFRLADIPIPKEVVEFKPTPAIKNEVEQLIEKKCCKEGCDNVIKNPGEIINIEVIDTGEEVRYPTAKELLPELNKKDVKPKNKVGRKKK